MTWQSAFRVIIRVIFIFAYIAFLAASIRHVATFFHNFESDPTDWINPYTLAVSIDLTALVLTVGVMFFRGNMPWYAQTFTWLFIVALTAFSWFVNWEYAMTFQGSDLKVNDTLRLLNPILASSFAFLNLAYSVVAEFFNSRTETAAELAAKVDELELLEEQQNRLAQYKNRTRQPSVIQRVKATAIEAKAAAKEVMKTDETVSSGEHDPGLSNVAQSERVTEPKNEPAMMSFDEPENGPVAMPADELVDEPDQDEMPEADEPSIGSLSGSLRERIIIPLDEPEDELDLDQGPNTDKLNKPAVGSKKSSNKELVKKIRTRVKRNRNVAPTQLAKDYHISSQHAGRIKAQILKELVQQ